jgi:hypothetical protein
VMVFAVDQRDLDRFIRQNFAAYRPPKPPPIMRTLGGLFP